MRITKLLSLLLACMLVFGMVAGCQSTQEETKEPSASTDATGSDTTPADEPDTSNEPTEAPSTDVATEDLEEGEWLGAGAAAQFTLNDAVLPIADEMTTLSVWRSFDSYMEFSDFNNSNYKRAVAEATNINLEFNTATSSTASEKFGLMLVSEDYTDLMQVPSLSLVKSGDAAIEDEIVIDLRDYDASLYPNYTQMMQYNQQVYKMCRTDTGAMWGFFTVYREPETAWTGLSYRTDLAEKVGYTGGAPVTIADWEVLLQAYKDGGVEVPLAFSQYGYFYYGEFATAYDVYPGLYAENGTDVKYGFIQDGFRDYLQLMVDWKARGFIPNDFVGWDADNDGTAYMGFGGDVYYDDTVGASMFVFSFNKAQLVDLGLAESPDYYREGTCEPRLTEDQIVHLGTGVTYASSLPLAISTQCADIELAIKFCDFLYTKEGFEFANYGVEGVTFNYDENGEPVSTDLLLNNPDGYSYGSYKFADWCWRVGLYTNLQNKEEQPDPTIYDISDIWGWNYDGAWVIPGGITLTAEETEEYSSAYSDIQTYVGESIPKFITGDLNLDSDWETFVANVKQMNIERCCEIYQAGVDRYNAR